MHHAIERMANSLTGRPYAAWPTVRAADATEHTPTLTDSIRSMIKIQGPLTALQIAVALDVPGSAGRVWALLKNDIRLGRIVAREGQFHWSWAYDVQMQTKLRDAAKLLRRHGYAVTGGEL
jgi:hypothetical protein